MKKIVTIILTLLLLVGCSRGTSEKVAEEYLESIKSMDFESAKTYMANEKSFFSIENFGDSLYEGYVRVGLSDFDDESKEIIKSAARKYVDEAVVKSMDFDYEILEKSNTSGGIEVVVKLDVLNGEDFKSHFKELEEIERGSYALNLEKAEALSRGYETLIKELKDYESRVSKEFKLKLIKVDGTYKVENGVEIMDVLIEPFTSFIGIFSN
ncbi:hypothetical protein [Anaerosphaera multitolerans]|uniref:DUF5105 domain-containing protein n=1 Tax=Anaerosphaera multitolerans TaxID=2487351 RepID=A0A437S4M0_9FIRM|nr:hypothetical protein [Anaerosphaera multitolerans]RVU53961.1 hypothetical protein EF514_09980 [Anaerosphaera multitolerans]